MTEDNGSKRKTWWPAGLWILSIFVTPSGVVTTGQLSHAVSSAAGGHVSETDFRIFWGSMWWIFVKGWHATEFGILFTLLGRVLSTRWAAILAISYAFCDEAHQILVPHRGCHLSDVCIDSLGVLAAWALLEWFRRRRSQGPLPPKWLVAIYVLAWLAGLFILSFHPFGLIELYPSPPGSIPAP